MLWLKAYLIAVALFSSGLLLGQLVLYGRAFAPRRHKKLWGVGTALSVFVAGFSGEPAFLLLLLAALPIALLIYTLVALLLHPGPNLDA
jgi:hypothetical protein